MRRIFRHIISGVFIFSILAATLIVMYFTFPHLQSNVNSLRAAISPEQQHVKKHVSLGESIVTVYLADTEQKRTLGLSNRTSLPPTYGMLFTFPTNDFHGIWMKDMRFSIDIIWIDNHSEVVHIEENVDPSSYPDIYYPAKPSLYVLEVNAGYVDSEGIKVGDMVTIY